MNPITIHNTQLPIVEYRGQRVVTLAMIDQVHERPEGTAGRTFTAHKERLIEGADYFFADTSQKDVLRCFGIEVPNRGLILLVEQGYLMLVKPFTDDLSWAVQRQLVSNYFRPQPFVVPQTRAEAMRLAADLEEQNEVLALENQLQAKKIEALENLFMPGETVPQFAKRLNGVNSQQMLAYLIEIKWVYNAEHDPDSSPKYRVYAVPRDKHWLTEKPITIRGEGILPFIKYTPVMLEEGARRLHDMYLAKKLPMKQTWDGKFTVSKFTSESPL
ncbi:ORF6N domain-containing protein [Pseudomonas sp. MWU12-2345]|uniref:ORF6N domain-containing protein n=1 Tax=Pseudomonas sp. MWU12-2345 TaxID=2928689 RepID=UPI00200FA64E|nr:ORF6N domain-containing protein [Pseudomonas sp. MWU12-2345]